MLDVYFTSTSDFSPRKQNYIEQESSLFLLESLMNKTAAE